MTTASNRSVGEWVTERPSRSRVFERFGIDYCCGGKRRLDAACSQAGLELNDVLQALQESDACCAGDQEVDWSQAKMADLVDHIVSTHHAYLRRELPRLAAMGAKVVAAHGDRHPEVVTCQEVFTALQAELSSHMDKEEQILFPMIKALEDAESAPQFHCGVIENPVAVMEDEHDSAARALSKLRDLTHGYEPPDEACNTYRAWLDGLRELEADMHRHVHKENNILFPKAIHHQGAGQATTPCARRR